MNYLEPQAQSQLGGVPPSYDDSMRPNDDKQYTTYTVPAPGFSQDVLPTYSQPMPHGLYNTTNNNVDAIAVVHVDENARQYDVPDGVKHEETYIQFSERSIRMGFIRKVYIILSLQLLITFGLISIFIFVEPIKTFCLQNWWMMFVSTGAMIFSIILSCIVVVARRQYPLNLILLLTFTLSEAFAVATITTYFSVTEVILAFGITMLITVSITIFSLQDKWDFTMKNAMLFVLICFLVIIAASCGIYFGFGFNYHCVANINMLGFIYYTCYYSASYFIFCTLFALIFSLFLVVDTQWMIGGKHKYGISPEEYIFAAMNLYMDIILIFLYLLMLLGGGNRS